MTDGWSGDSTPRRSVVPSDDTEVPDRSPARGRRALPDPDPEPPRRSARRVLEDATDSSSELPGPRHASPASPNAPEPPSDVSRPATGSDTPARGWEGQFPEQFVPVTPWPALPEAQPSTVAPSPISPSPTPSTPGPSPAPVPDVDDDSAADDELAADDDLAAMEATRPHRPSNHSDTSETSETEPDDAQSTKDKSRVPLIITIVVLTVALAAAAWVVFSQLSNRTTPAPAPEAPSSSASASPDPENTEGAQAAVGELVLNDTSLTAPTGWNLYGDELIETDRRVIRLSHAETDVRLQVVSLTSAEGDLSAACEALSNSQQEQFSDVTATPTLSAGVNPDQGAGVTCGFEGTRVSDNVTNTVSFTLLLRVEDGHVLMLRSMVPTTVTPGAESRQQLAAMNCTASLNFGVTLPLC